MMKMRSTRSLHIVCLTSLVMVIGHLGIVCFGREEQSDNIPKARRSPPTGMDRHEKLSVRNGRHKKARSFIDLGLFEDPKGVDLSAVIFPKDLKNEDEAFWGRFLQGSMSMPPTEMPTSMPTSAASMPSDMPTMMNSNIESNVPTSGQSDMETNIPTPGESRTPGTVVDIIDGNDELLILNSTLKLIGLDQVLSGDGPFTVFAPLDTAFSVLDQDHLIMLLEPNWALHLADLLLYHATVGSILSTDLSDGDIVNMGNLENITVSVSDEGVFFSGHYFNNSKLLDADMEASNGVVHTVDSVFIPASFVIDLYTLLDTTGAFTALITLVGQTGLEDEIRNSTLTILAPVDSAFAALPSDLVTYLTDADNIDVLKSILLYHTIDQVIPSPLFADGQNYTTLNGNDVFVFVSTTGGNETITFANSDSGTNISMVVLSDGLAKNGIAHAIDTVLFPPDFQFPMA